MPADPRAAPRISVVVCTHNGAARLPTVLGALARQRVDPPTMEVLVVADHCTDGSEAVAEGLGVRVVPVLEGRGLAAARNTGISHTSGPLLAFTDDDCEPAEDWVAQLLVGLADPTVDGVGGRTVAASDAGLALGYVTARNPLAPLPALLLESSHPWFRLRHYLRTGQGPSIELAPGTELYAVSGSNMAFRRELLDALGGFDPRIDFGSEEEDLCQRAHLRRPPARFLYRPEAVVHHHFRPGVADVVRRARAYGRGNARSAAEHAGVPPIVYPFPLLWLAVQVCAVRSGARGQLAAVALPPVLYVRWLPFAWRCRDPRALVYPYLQVAQECATMVGELEFWRQQRSG